MSTTATATATTPAPEHRAAEAARRRYFPGVEGMRGVAAVTVLIGHVLVFGYAPGGDVSLYGFFVATLGVWIFFGISGFLLYRPFVAARGEGDSVGSLAPSFLVRRFVRIFPAYWVALTLLAIWPGLTGVFTDHFWVSYALLRNYSNAWSSFGIGPAWTLSVEVTFYLTLPIYAFVMQRIGVNSGRRGQALWEYGTLGLLAIASIYARAKFANTAETEYIGLWLPTTFAFFCVGMAMAASDFSPGRVAARLRKILARPELCWPVAVAVFIYMAESPFSVAEPYAWVPWATGLAENLVVAGLLLAPAVFGDGLGSVRALLGNRVIVYLGTVSYGIYLWHLPLLYYFRGSRVFTSSPFPLVTLFLSTFAAAVFFATLSWYLVEKPLMKRVRSVKALRRSGPPDPPPPPAPGPSATVLAEPAP